MRKLFYGIAYEQHGNTVLHPGTFTSAREAQAWADYQRTERQDATRYRVVRIQPTEARP